MTDIIYQVEQIYERDGSTRVVSSWNTEEEAILEIEKLDDLDRCYDIHDVHYKVIRKDVG